ncbi:MAG: ribbon-helix-helix protein, CopG family, partial [Candidatus Omnitrophica bacterium]|nr:ribbon-helix-helix protein, CopG family [Candidatus Omnitrophota bacterium]
MSTKNPRLNVVLEPTLMKGVDHLARAQGVSLSTMARDLIKEALETYEDGQWHKIAQRRAGSFSSKKALS